MLDNKLRLTSVVEFLRRGRVDRGTGGGKVVIVVDSSTRKVAEAASVAAPMVSAPQPHPNPQQYFLFIRCMNSPPIRHINISGLFHLGIVRPYPIICLILHT